MENPIDARTFPLLQHVQDPLRARPHAAGEGPLVPAPQQNGQLLHRQRFPRGRVPRVVHVGAAIGAGAGGCLCQGDQPLERAVLCCVIGVCIRQ